MMVLLICRLLALDLELFIGFVGCIHTSTWRSGDLLGHVTLDLENFLLF